MGPMSRLPKSIAEMQSVLGDKIVRAYQLAEQAHKGQKRKTGDDYIVHPIAVARMLFEIGADEDVICAAFLHDAVEDADHPEAIREHIYREFGDQVLYLVEAVSKDAGIADKIEQQQAYMEQMRRAFEVDIFAFFIKVCDLLDNMKSITALSQERKDRWIKELKYQYMPLFAEFFPRIPLVHQEMYSRMIDAVESTIGSIETASRSTIDSPL